MFLSPFDNIIGPFFLIDPGSIAPDPNLERSDAAHSPTRPGLFLIRLIRVIRGKNPVWEGCNVRAVLSRGSLL